MQEQSFLSGLVVNNRLRDILGTLVTWAKIIAIINFVTIPLEFYKDVKADDVFSGMIIAVITVVINIYLVKFSIKVKRGLSGTDQEDFNSGMKDLRDYFKIVGIFLIILIVMMVVLMLYGISGANSFS